IVKKIVETEYPNPSGRIAERQEVADLVAFICSDLAGFINGQNIRIDGGAVCYV
ncbi:MAG: SDR family oxidoreductase, partial [Gammaproteobacteria bacterium]|nr:SDR family oxidoreductase [Gammaproteobacteria bacterium]